MKIIYKSWRKYAPPFIFIFQIISGIYLPNIIYGTCILLWLTVPCGIMSVNKFWWLWYPRQLFFAVTGILSIIGN